jgi:hypothetical protein
MFAIRFFLELQLLEKSIRPCVIRFFLELQLLEKSIRLCVIRFSLEFQFLARLIRPCVKGHSDFGRCPIVFESSLDLL